METQWGTPLLGKVLLLCDIAGKIFFLRRAKMQLFQVENRTCVVSYSHFQNLHLCNPVFLYLLYFIYHAVIPSEVVRMEPHPHNFSNLDTFLAALQTMIEKNEIMILCSICTLIFLSGRRERCRACHMHLGQLRNPRGGRFDSFYCLSFRDIFSVRRLLGSRQVVTH